MPEMRGVTDGRAGFSLGLLPRLALRPFDIFGMNAILAYVVSLLIGLAGMRLGFQATGFAAIDGVIHAPCLSSFLYAVAVLLVVLALLLPLHRRGIHLRL